MPAETAQTLDRGLRLLSLVAGSPEGLSVTEAAEALGVGRAVVYRLVTTLAAHGLVRRDADGRVVTGPGVLALARAGRPMVAEVAAPALRQLAEEIGATAHLTVAEAGEALALAVVEPSWTTFHVAYRSGTRHPLDRGAAGLAILAQRPGTRLPRTGQPRTDGGWFVSTGALQDGAHGVAAPVLGVAGLEASVGVITVTPLDDEMVGPLVIAAAAAVAAALH